MKIGKILSPVSIALSLAVVVLGAGHANAQNAPGPGNALRISPVRTDVSIKPGESKVVDVYVQNLTRSPAKLQGVVNDFGASDDESGKPRLFLDNNATAPKHGLSRYVKPIGTYTIQPNENKNVKVTVSMPANVAGGGYYGAVRFVPEGGDGERNVALSASVGSLILVSVPGDVKEQLSVESFNVSKPNGKASTFFTSGDSLQNVVRFRNAGNIQLEPFGKVNVKKGDQQISSIEINDSTPRSSILPDSIRRYTVDLGSNAKSFGKYTVEASFGYGTSGQVVNASTSFYVIPWAYIVGLLVLLAAIIAAIFKWRSGRQSKVSRRKR